MCREGDESTTDKERSFIVVGVFHGNVLSWFCLIACAFFFFLLFTKSRKRRSGCLWQEIMKLLRMNPRVNLRYSAFFLFSFSDHQFDFCWFMGWLQDFGFYSIAMVWSDFVMQILRGRVVFYSEFWNLVLLKGCFFLLLFLVYQCPVPHKFYLFLQEKWVPICVDFGYVYLGGVGLELL